jgi:hypothetical protein
MTEDGIVEVEGAAPPNSARDERLPMAATEESGLRLRPLEESPYPIECLEEGLRVEAIAAACRSALVQVLVGVDAGWGRAEFDAWVGEAWALGSSAGPESVGRAHRGRFAHTVRARQCHVSDELFRVLLCEAHARVVSVLQAASPPVKDSSFALAAIRRGFVVQVCDEDGQTGWVPVDVPGMWPVERLLALAATDFLARPGDYDRACAAPLAMWRLGRAAGSA